MKPFVSIIIPIYNGERSIHYSLTSLQNLEYGNLEIIFVNDASTDNSVAIIEKFVLNNRQNANFKFKILHHFKNFGVATARNTGLDSATGEYIYYLDADDQLESDSLTQMVGLAIENKCDIVGCNWTLSFKLNRRKMNQYAFSDPNEACEAFLLGKMRWNLWLFLVKRSLYEDNNIRFIPEMDMGEDLLVMCKLFTHAKKVSYLNEYFYHYNQTNTNSLTKVYSDKHIHQVTQNVLSLESFLIENNPACLLDGKMDILKLNIKLPMLISNNRKSYKNWFIWFQESNALALDKRYFNLRTRFLHWSAIKSHHWMIRLYYIVVVRFVYGIIYR